MKRTTLWAQCALLLLFATLSTRAQTVSYAQFGSTPSTIANDGTGQIGIGTTSPEALLHVKGESLTNPLIKVTHTFNSPYYFVGETNAANPGFPPTFTTETRFVINSLGYVGIGDVDPEGPLMIDYKHYFEGSIPSQYPFGENPIISVEDFSSTEVFNLAMSGDGTTHGVSMMMQAPVSSVTPAFVVHNGSGLGYLSVMGNGVAGFGVSMASTPVAH